MLLVLLQTLLLEVGLAEHLALLPFQVGLLLGCVLLLIAPSAAVIASLWDMAIVLILAWLVRAS